MQTNAGLRHRDFKNCFVETLKYINYAHSVSYTCIIIQVIFLLTRSGCAFFVPTLKKYKTLVP